MSTITLKEMVLAECAKQAISYKDYCLGRHKEHRSGCQVGTSYWNNDYGIYQDTESLSATAYVGVNSTEEEVKVAAKLLQISLPVGG